jgi:hypothetical protein
VDSAKPSTLPFPIHKAQSPISTLACRTDKEFDFAEPAGLIRQTTGPTTQIKLYTHSVPIWTVRVRNVAGTDRVYFSSPRVNTELSLVDIFMLKDGAVSLYTTIDSTKLTIPNPCNPGEEMWLGYGGDFAFSDGDVLYLSSGNWVGGKVGIYRIGGAGPDKVTGTVERIFLSDGPVQALCFESAQTLYFIRRLADAKVWKLDLSTMSETFVMSIKTFPERESVRDITLVGTGFEPLSGYWEIWGFFSLLLDKGASFLWRFGESLMAKPPKKPPDE